MSEPNSSPDSLFSTSTGSSSPLRLETAQRTCPPIPGLYVFPGLLPSDAAGRALKDIGDADVFSGGTRDQAMLFEPPFSKHAIPSLPPYIMALLSSIEKAIQERVPNQVYNLVFRQHLARQVILNLYAAGQGITSHVDLPNRYADGILGCSLIGGCTMRFEKEPAGNEARQVYQVYLEPRTVYILSGEARWAWKHEIEARLEDRVDGEDGLGHERILRDLRLSVTFRWMKRGADVLS
ncbi:uncharacterized protein L203_104711 [Cryptococcus depauperatus CBS 7841]|uniref:Uncharacterized protein n=1 Tax=Cryptococcus depauperatus CBS 7841 TaxID=1295531 RepID=A0A1E3IL96_9TREE|nr:hypothetical protein L203_02081 [Cryptococcus depauperatus CBS 7841]